MGGSSRRGYEDQVAAAMKQQAEMGKESWDMYKPYLSQVLSTAGANLPKDFGKEFTREAFAAKEGEMRAESARSIAATEQALEQQLRQSGTNLNASAYARLKQQGRLQAAQSLQSAITQQRTQYAVMGAQQAMDLANILRGGATGAGGMAQGSYAQQMQALQFLMQNAGGSKWGNAAGGAISGASAGSAGGWVGALAGAAVGGYAGYNS